MRLIRRAALGGLVAGALAALFMMFVVDPAAGQGGPPQGGQISANAIGYGPGVYAVQGWYIPPNGTNSAPTMTIQYQDMAAWQFAPPNPPVYSVGADCPTYNGYQCYKNDVIQYWDAALQGSSSLYVQVSASWGGWGGGGAPPVAALAFSTDHYFNNQVSQSIGFYTAYPAEQQSVASAFISLAPIRESIIVGAQEYDPWVIHCSGYQSSGDTVRVQVKKRNVPGWDALLVDASGSMGMNWVYNQLFVTTHAVGMGQYCDGFRLRYGKQVAGTNDTLWTNEVTIMVDGYAR